MRYAILLDYCYMLVMIYDLLYGRGKRKRKRAGAERCSSAQWSEPEGRRRNGARLASRLEGAFGQGRGVSVSVCVMRHAKLWFVVRYAKD